MTIRLHAGLFTAAIAATAITFSAASAPQTDWSAVANALGKSGMEMPGNVYRIGLPRPDLKVSVDNVELKPAFALGSDQSRSSSLLSPSALLASAETLRESKRAPNASPRRPSSASSNRNAAPD